MNADIWCRTLTETSDSTLKTNIKPIQNGNLLKISKLKAYNFQWKADNSKKENIGLLAQQVERVFPEVIHVNDSTGLKSIAYTQLIPILIDAINEQQINIQEIEKQTVRL